MLSGDVHQGHSSTPTLESRCSRDGPFEGWRQGLVQSMTVINAFFHGSPARLYKPLGGPGFLMGLVAGEVCRETLKGRFIKREWLTFQHHTPFTTFEKNHAE